MSVKDTIAAMRGEPRAAGIKLGMSKLNDAFAKALYGRPYSPCIAAEAAGKPPQPSWDQARCAQVALSYGIHAGSLTAVVLATVTRLRVVQTLIEDPPELPLDPGRLASEAFPLGAPPQEGITVMTIDPADDVWAQELLSAVEELPLPAIQGAGMDPKPHLLKALVAHANREGLYLDGMADEGTFDGVLERLSDVLRKELRPSNGGEIPAASTPSASWVDVPQGDGQPENVSVPDGWPNGRPARAMYAAATNASDERALWRDARVREYREAMAAIAEHREKGTPLTDAQREFMRMIEWQIKGANASNE